MRSPDLKEKDRQLDMLVERTMTLTPRTVAPSDSVAHARALLDEFGVGQLPVVAAGQLIGMVTAGDLKARRSAWRPASVARAVTSHPERVPVRRVMRTSTYTVQPSDTLRKAAKLMAQARVGALPVMEHGKLRGIISAIDIAVKNPTGAAVVP